jgi:signal transduction histidine kinase
MLSVLTLTLVVVSLVLVLTVRRGTGSMALLAAAASGSLTLVVYILSRTRLAPVGAWLLIVGLLISSPPQLYFAAPASFATGIAYVPTVVILGLILLPLRPTLGIAAFNVACPLVILGLRWGEISQHAEAFRLFTTVFTSMTLICALVMVLAFVRNHDIRVAEGLAARLDEYNRTLEAQVEARTHDLRIAKEEADAARERAEQADQVKSQFLASMSHELRTPLNAILNFTEMMGLGMMGPVNDQQKDVLGKSLDSGRHLLHLINDVLDISKMQSGMLGLFVEDNVNLHAELDAVVMTAEALLKATPVRFVKDIDPALPSISGDRRRIRQILLNLISNAAKFTEQGTITLSARRRGDEVLFSVTDTGPGISAEQQAIIFQPFIQTEAGVRHGGGTGLGLPISKHLAEAHGGRLWVESEPDRGAAFYVTLPIIAAMPAASISLGGNGHAVHD